jgi:hypothetical protein
MKKANGAQWYAEVSFLKPFSRELFLLTSCEDAIRELEISDAVATSICHRLWLGVREASQCGRHLRHACPCWIHIYVCGTIIHGHVCLDIFFQMDVRKYVSVPCRCQPWSLGCSGGHEQLVPRIPGFCFSYNCCTASSRFPCYLLCLTSPDASSLSP